ncbi:FapA family protein [Cytobacillus sp. FJAT-54145]|uniref:FapA family protein n=1 Tax=Cytobacillus spartinae TaxID=3299023 RepID=A0ABW6K4L9_9BACI
MEKPFKVIISKDRLKAEIDLIEKLDERFSISVHELEELIKNEGITLGLNQEIIAEIANNPFSISFPVVIAEGILPKNGDDAYLLIESVKKEDRQKKDINFREVMEIPSVENGQIIATAVPQTYGAPGTDITGKQIQAKNGKPLKVRAGKNVIQNDNKFISTLNGQVSISKTMITVNPVFEVKGDIDLKTGNINFIGNVVIRGNVPTGYEVHAGGDIKIYGLVEGAHITSKGNIVIMGGVTGGNRGKIEAEGSIHAAYLNQANVKAGQDLFVDSSLLHSFIQTGGSIFCKNGHVIGGQISSGKDIHVKNVGNHLFTKTDLFIGFDPILADTEMKLKQEIFSVSENIKKIDEIESKIIEVAKKSGQLSEEHKTLILKQRATKKHFTTQIEDLNETLQELEDEKQERLMASVFIYDTVYPNTTLHFGKYSQNIQRKHTYVRFYFSNSEVAFEPI